MCSGVTLSGIWGARLIKLIGNRYSRDEGHEKQGCHNSCYIHSLVSVSIIWIGLYY